MKTYPIIYGGNEPCGYEEEPQLRFDETDKSGISEVTAVISRRINVQKKFAPEIISSASFPGQLLTINGKNYGAGWEMRNLTQSPDGADWCIISFEHHRTGVTPFEWGMPPGLSMESANGVSSLFYRPPAAEKIEMLRWDSGTGESRYGWKVEYVNEFNLAWGTWTSYIGMVPAYMCKISLENVPQFVIPATTSVAGLAREEQYTEYYPPGFDFISRAKDYLGSFATEAEAQAEAEEKLPAFVQRMESYVDENIDFMYARTRFISTQRPIEVKPETAKITTRQFYTLDSGLRWGYKLSVDAVRLVVDASAYRTLYNRGLHWESVTDLSEESPTYRHVFYRLKFINTVIFSLDITSVSPGP